MSGVLERLRVGFIGAGGIAQRHLDVLRQMPDVEIVAVADPDFNRAAAVADKLGAQAYNSYSDIIARERLDCAFVCVPPFAHGAIEAALIAAGLPFFVEKPLSLDIATSERLGSAGRGSPTRHGRRLPLAISRYGRRGAGISCRQACNARNRPLARPDPATAMVVASGSVGGTGRRAGDALDRSGSPSRRRGD